MDISGTVLKFVPHLQFLALLHTIVAKHWVEVYRISNHRAILSHVFLELWSALLNDKISTIKFIGMEYYRYTAEHLCKHRVLSNVRRMFLLYMTGKNINRNRNEFRKILHPILLFSPLFPVLISVIFWKSAKRSNENLKEIKQNKANFDLFVGFCGLKRYH